MIQSENFFSKIGLNLLIVKSLNEMKYIHPSPIQKLCIPHLLSGKDILGMAQTGSGKTAAFALPLLQNIIISVQYPQILVLTPTRELAIQVAKSFSEFAKYIKKIKVLPLYGGQRYELQLKILRQGPQVIIGTPGRLLDHLKRKTLNLMHLKTLVLDEADEMLRMGFIDDVKNIMSNIPKKHQTALFSATMPNIIRNISKKFMNNPKIIKIKSNVITRPNIQQNYWIVYGRKIDGLIRFLEIEQFSATIVFVRTKYATLEISEILEKHGYNSSALNGDMNQNLREQTLEKFKNGRLDILIATDIAARGLDVDRINLVINYDIPMDVESYIHRIGRTGRAGRSGRALLFVEPRERRLLKNIERIVRYPIKRIELPTVKLLSKYRVDNFYKKLVKYIHSKDLNEYYNLLKKINSKNEFSMKILATALLKIAQEDRPLLLKEKNTNYKNNIKYNNQKNNYFYSKKRKKSNNKKKKKKIFKKKKKINHDFNIYYISIGFYDKIHVYDIIQVICNYKKMHSHYIRNIKLFSKYTILELYNNCLVKIDKKFIYFKSLNKSVQIKFKKKIINVNTKNFFTKKFKKIKSQNHFKKKNKIFQKK